MHRAGSPQAQGIVMVRQADLEKKIAMTDKVIEHSDDVPGIPVIAPLPTP